MVCAIEDINNRLSTTDHNSLAHESAKNPVVSKVNRFTREGWPPKKDEEGTKMQRFRQLADSLSIVNGCLLYCSRVVVPTSQCRQVLEQLHLGYFGIQKMEQLPRTAVYWPNIDVDIEATCRY